MTTTIDNKNKYINHHLAKKEKNVFNFEKVNENHSMNFSWLAILIKVSECSCFIW